MENTFREVHYDIDRAIDLAFEGHFVLKFYDYLKIRKAKKYEIEEFISSSTVKEIQSLICDLEGYLEGGSDEIHKQLREGYGHLSKPYARKIKKYLNDIIDDAWRYNNEKRPGRRKKESK